MTDHRPSPSAPAEPAGAITSDPATSDPAAPTEGATPEAAQRAQEEATALRLELATTRQELRQLATRGNVQGERVLSMLRVLMLSSAFLSAGTMLLGSLMKFFIPVSGDDRSLTLYQVLDPDESPDLVDDGDWGTGAGWYIPIAMVLICTVLVASVGAVTSPTSRSMALITITEVLCWCLAVGCLLGFAVLAGLRNVVGVPGGLMTILFGAALGILTCRVARVYAD